MKVKNTLPLIYIVYKCLKSSKSKGLYSVSLTHLRWIICYSNFISSLKYNYILFDIKNLYELQESDITNMINNIDTTLNIDKVFLEKLSKIDRVCLDEAISKYKHGAKLKLKIFEFFGKLSSSIKK